MNISRKWLREFVDVRTTDNRICRRRHDPRRLQKVETTERHCDAEIQKRRRRQGPVDENAMKTPIICGSAWSTCGGTVSRCRSSPAHRIVHEGDLVPVAQHDSATCPAASTSPSGKLRGVRVLMVCCCSLTRSWACTEHDCPEAYENGIWILQRRGLRGRRGYRTSSSATTIQHRGIRDHQQPPGLLFSLIGLAREAAARVQRAAEATTSRSSRAAPEGDLCDLLDRLDVQSGPDLCPRYTARMVTQCQDRAQPQVDAAAPARRRASVRSTISSISPTMSCSNTASPCTPLTTAMSRAAKSSSAVRGEDETLTTPRRQCCARFSPDMLVIADDDEARRPCGRDGRRKQRDRGRYGTTVVFESANFLGSSIRKTALALGMRTDASAKFEKDIDPMLTVPAVNRACELVELLGAGEVMDGMIDVLNYVPQPVTVKLEPERINALLGTDISEADMIEYLRREEVPVVDGMIQVPSWRPDLRVMADIAEEVARYYGYNNIETTLMRGATTMGGYSDEQKLENAAGAAARALGYSEIITYSFVSPLLVRRHPPSGGQPAAQNGQARQSARRGYLHHAHSHSAEYAGYPLPQLCVQEQGRQAL